MNSISSPYQRNGKGFFCPVMLTVDMIAGKWKLLTLWQLLQNGGTMRYGEIRKNLRTISEKMLIQTLRELEGDGLVSRQIFPEVPPKVEYSLTDDGREFRKILESLGEFGEKWRVIG